jgi:hypothetical protein
MRKLAFIRLSEHTNNCIREIKLPKIPQPCSNNFQPQKRKTTLTRSKTENQISTIREKNVSNPFGSFLAPLSIKEVHDDDEDCDTMHKKADNQFSCSPLSSSSDSSSSSTIFNKKSTSSGTSSRPKYVYTVDFLLKRAESNQAKKMPHNWLQLNQKFSDICFCGKVISYFNPNKYYDHWNKVQKLNPELHPNLNSFQIYFDNRDKFETPYRETVSVVHPNQTHLRNVKSYNSDEQKSFKRLSVNNNLNGYSNDAYTKFNANRMNRANGMLTSQNLEDLFSNHLRFNSNSQNFTAANRKKSTPNGFSNFVKFKRSSNIFE